MRIDAHHHLWQYTPAEYGWIDDSMSSLRRDFLVSDLERELTAAHVDAAITVQARQTVAESTWLLSLAASTSKIAAVVGWLPLADPNLPALLDPLRANTKLRGLRHIVQAEPAGFLDDPAFNRGIAHLTAQPNGLAYDILIFPPQLPEAIRFVDRHPNQPFILDHIAKPRIAAAQLEPWATHIRSLGRRPNVTCKLSGLVTEADPRNWSPAQLQPYFDIVLEAFTPQRLMIGTDWPVCLLGCTYSQWWHTVETWISPLTPTERADILGLTTARAYKLK